MEWRQTRQAYAIVGLLIATTMGCSDSSEARDPNAPVVLVPVDTLVETASELVGGVYDLAVAPDGEVHIADYGFKHVLVVGPDGSVRRTIGREGQGPGEFEMPYVVSASADSLWVVDATSNRVQVFDRPGNLGRSYLLDAPSLGSGRAFRGDGALGATIDGFEGAMVLVLASDGTRIRMFGEPIVPNVSFYDFSALKAEIRDSRVPDAFRNRAMLAWAPDHSAYLAFLAEPEVRRYDAVGELLWASPLNEPVLRKVRETFVRENIEEQNPSRVHSLQYVSDLAVVDGNLWLLLNTASERDGLLLVLDADNASVLHRLSFSAMPNTGQFAVDESRGLLYLAARGEASVVVFDLCRVSELTEDCGGARTRGDTLPSIRRPS
jgi:hypothetical protein